MLARNLLGNELGVNSRRLMGGPGNGRSQKRGSFGMPLRRKLNWGYRRDYPCNYDSKHRSTNLLPHYSLLLCCAAALLPSYSTALVLCCAPALMLRLLLVAIAVAVLSSPPPWPSCRRLSGCGYIWPK